jgi:mevalonate kinase
MVQFTQKGATGRAHGKLILIGEHAVVYGKPAIALPFPSIEVSATIEGIPGVNMIACDYYDGPLSAIPKKMFGIAACIKETLRVLNKPDNGLLIRLCSTIPLGRGLGSSTAVALAIVRGLFAYFEHQVEQAELMALVHIAEKHAHGNPSGIDMAAVSSEQPIWFQKGEEIQSLQIGAHFFLVVADSGRIGGTKDAVKGVKEKYQLNPEKTQDTLNRLEKITYEVRDALFMGQLKLIGSLLNLAQEELKTLGVSDAGLNKLIDAARNAGALGAKLTGGGLGGCVLALVQTEEQAIKISNVFLETGAQRTWHFRLESR